MSSSAAVDGPGLRSNITLLILAVAVGVLAGYAALALLWSITWVQNIAFGFDHARVYSAASRLDAVQVALIPAVGGLVVGLIMRYVVPGRRNHGPADAMQAVREGDGRISLRAGLTSAAASALAIGTGASLGRYGPSVHLGASIASWVGERLRRAMAERHVLIGCGVAAAISASFNAPLAGVLFAHEVMLENFARRGFVAITIASVSGQAVARAHDASFSLTSLSDYAIGHNHEYLLFAVVGVLGGCLAVAFIRALDVTGDLAARVPLPEFIKPALAGLVVGILATRYPQVLGMGDEAIHDAIGQLFPLSLLLVLLVAKLVAAALCRGFGFPGGVFAPSLFLGTMLGAALGQALVWVDPALVSSPAIYSIAGMGAVTACVIGAPITTILIVFELTGSYPLTTAVMIAVVVATLTAHRLLPMSWFHLQLQQRGVDVLSGREVRIMRARTVAELVSSPVEAIAPEASTERALEQALEADAGELFVADANGTLLGQVSLAALVRAVNEGRGQTAVGELAQMPAIVLTHDDDLDQVMQRLRYFVGTSVPVVDSEQGRVLAGVVFQSSVIGAYNDAVTQARKEEQGET